MPLYEYNCPKCHKDFEIIQKFSDPPIAHCPDCGGPVEKRMSRTSFQLKGSGWYATDYKKSPAATSTAPSTTGTETKTPTSAEKAATGPAPAAASGTAEKSEKPKT